PDARVTFLVREAVLPIVRMCSWVDDVIIANEGRRLGSQYKDLRNRRFDAAVCLFPKLTVAGLLQRARIPVRVGTARRLYSFRFNRRVHVSRAGGGKHERDFNLDLLQGLALDNPKVVDPVCEPPAEAVDQAAQLLQRKGILTNDEYPVAIVHPGCSGSARNWSVDNYRELCRQLVDNGVKVVLSGAGSERELAGAVAGDLKDRISIIAGETDLETLAGIMQHADLFIGPSTGPMHLAAAVGLPVLALFGPVRTTTPDRWGPLGDRHHVFTPDVPTCNCKLDQCKLGDCMDRIAVPTVVEQAVMIIRSQAKQAPATEQQNVQTR
ncbi:MAG: hypothetical protein GF341_08960, partial [candidate division Zixibacteria bacterium]|nr:hypothetical protein [candidate division Zixibacteria bacterium]